MNYQTRNREMLGVIDHKNLSIYKNEQGSLTKMFQVNLIINDLKDIVQASAIYFFHREYLLVMSGEVISKISTRTSHVDQIRVQDKIKPSFGHLFSDSLYFYFITAGAEGHKLGVASVDMIEAAFN